MSLFTSIRTAVRKGERGHGGDARALTAEIVPDSTLRRLQER